MTHDENLPSADERADDMLRILKERHAFREKKKKGTQDKEQKRIHACVICRPAYLHLCDRLAASGFRNPTRIQPKGLSEYLRAIAHHWRASPHLFRDARPYAITELDWLRKRAGEPPIWSAWDVPRREELLTLIPPEYDAASWRALVDADVAATIAIIECWECHPWSPYEGRITKREAAAERTEREKLIRRHKRLKLPPPRFPPPPRRTASINPVLGDDGFEAFEEIRQHFGIDSYAHTIEALAFGWIAHPPVKAPDTRRKPKEWIYLNT